jgi:pullulanase/glycogen debranching enzyme
MREADWNDPDGRAVGVLLASADRRAAEVLVLLNAGAQALEFALPELDRRHWRLIADSAGGATPGEAVAGHLRLLEARAAAVFEAVAG